MRRFVAVLMGAALLAGPAPALAARNVHGCDIVNLAGPSSPVALPHEAREGYRDTVLALLAERAPAESLMDAQKALLGSVAGPDYDAYLASGSCLRLTSLDADKVEAVLAMLDPTLPDITIEAARQLADSARAQVEAITQAARFRSLRDRDRLSAGYYCFAAAVIYGLLPQSQQQRVGLDSFGDTAACADLKAG